VWHSETISRIYSTRTAGFPRHTDPPPTGAVWRVTLVIAPIKSTSAAFDTLGGALANEQDLFPTWLPLLNSTGIVVSEFVEAMNQVITAKLKLNLTAEQKLAVRDTALAYRDALNYTARVDE